MTEASGPTVLFTTLGEDANSTAELVELIDIELAAHNVTITPQDDGPPVVLGFVDLTIIPPEPSVTDRTNDLLVTMFQIAGYMDLSYTPGTGAVRLTLKEDFPTNEFLLIGGDVTSTLPLCGC